MRDIKAMLPEEIAAALAEMGQPKYRAKQIFQWLARGVTSFDEMTNLSKDLRAALSARVFISKLEMLRKQVSHRRDDQISLAARRRQRRRDRRHALQARQYGLHLLAGRLPAGVRVLRVDDRRPDPQS